MDKNSKRTIQNTDASRETKARSKFLSLVLRHRPATIGVELDGSGWVKVETLLHLDSQLAGECCFVETLR